MLVTTNKTVTIKRQQDTGGVRTYSNVYTGQRVYIQSTDDRLEGTFDDEGALLSFIMMTNNLDLQIGDQVIDETGLKYKIRGTQKFRDLTGTHTESSLTIIND